MVNGVHSTNAALSSISQKFGKSRQCGIGFLERFGKKLDQRFDFGGIQMVGVNMANNMTKSPVPLQLIFQLRGNYSGTHIFYFMAHLIEQFLMPVGPGRNVPVNGRCDPLENTFQPRVEPCRFSATLSR